MPYDNPYNRKIAREVEGFNKSYIKNIGDYYPLEGGSLDTGYDTQRIVGGAMEEYVRNVLSGSLNVPTQAMPSSSMSGMGMSAGMRKYNKGMGMSGAGFTGGYKKDYKLSQEQKDALAAKRLLRKVGLAEPKQKVYKEPSEKVKAKRLAITMAGDLLKQVPKARKARASVSGMADLEKLVGKQEDAFKREALRLFRKDIGAEEKQKIKERKSKKWDEAFDKEARKIERQMKREERGYVAKPRKANPWIDFVKMYSLKNNISYRDAIRDPQVKLGYRELMADQKRGSGMSGGWAYKGQKLGLARRDGVKKRDYGEPYKNRGKGVPKQLQDWQDHLRNVKQENPDLPLKSILVLAKDTYERPEVLPRPPKRRIRRIREEDIPFA